jgi:hypothetical protein
MENMLRASSLAALLLGLPVYAQSAGEIRGVAWDRQGRPVAGATIIVRGPTATTVTSGAGGFFTASKLAPGHYEVSGVDEKHQAVSASPAALELAAGHIGHADVTIGKSTKHYGFFKRLGRRLDGMS